MSYLIDGILSRKDRGLDCSQEESAAIKAHLLEIFRLFPLEWDEVVMAAEAPAPFPKTPPDLR